MIAGPLQTPQPCFILYKTEFQSSTATKGQGHTLVKSIWAISCSNPTLITSWVKGLRMSNTYHFEDWIKMGFTVCVNYTVQFMESQRSGEYILCSLYCLFTFQGKENICSMMEKGIIIQTRGKHELWYVPCIDFTPDRPAPLTREKLAVSGCRWSIKAIIESFSFLIGHC